MKIAIEREDGGVSVMELVEGAELDVEIAKWEEGTGLRAVSHRDAGELPTDRTFRNAWKITDKAIAVDMDKARGIQMERIREARDAKLSTLDVPFMKAIEAGDDAKRAEIATAKQTLRDLPATIDLTKAETPEALAAIWPEELAPAQEKAS